MKTIIVAAGYATRLYPLTENFPKPLLDVGGKTILDWLFDQLEEVPGMTGAYLVTNSRFAGHFESWKQKRQSPLPVEILDDGTSTNDTRLGAIGDIQLAIDRYGIDDDTFVCAADNILQFPLVEFFQAFQQRRASHICARYLEDLAARQRTGIVLLDDNDSRVLEFAEKPEKPKSCWGVPPLYIYPREILPKFKAYLAEGGNPDAPGNFIAWLCLREPVHAYRMNGNVLDIGNLASLEAARALLSQ